MTTTENLIHTIKEGNRAALARGITLVESTRLDHQKQAQDILTSLLPDTGHSIRIGITGAPGVGKSTFIESLGLSLIEKSHKVAVMAVDPSSTKTGGSILGDKTRMSRLSQNDNAFIRPSPSSGTLGGVARRTREGMLLAEAAGYDIILVETVGVGQSEVEVADMVDMFVLLLLPGSGDELQGIKKGIVELADLLVVNKADGDQLAQAKRVCSDYAGALRMLNSHDTEHWQPQVQTCSALHNDGIDDIWTLVEQFQHSMKANGAWDARRHIQAKAWMWKEIRSGLLQNFEQHPAVSAQIRDLEKKVIDNTLSPSDAAQSLINTYLKS